MPSDYRFAGPLRLRALGVLVALVGVVVLLAVVVVAAADLSALVLLVTAVVLLLAAGACAGWLQRAVVVRLGEGGYRVRYVRGAGVRQAAWRDVEDVAAVTVGGARCLQLRLRDGRSTVVPVGVLAAPPEAFVADLQQHLDRGHGYRPLRRPPPG